MAVNLYALQQKEAMVILGLCHQQCPVKKMTIVQVRLEQSATEIN
jgi:hypothetical protein